MNPNETILNSLTNLFHKIDARRRFQLCLLFGLVLLTAFAEILSIGSILPFLGVLTSPENFYKQTYIKPLILLLDLTEPQQLILLLTLLFGISVFIAGAMRLLLLWGTTRLSYGIGAEISVEIYRRTLYQPYAVHCERNTSELINGISIKSKIVINIINMALTLFGSVIMLIVILVALVTINPLIASVIFIGLGTIYFTIGIIARNKLSENSRMISHESNIVIKCLQEGLGGIREILIDGNQEVYCDIYRKADFSLRDATASNIIISTSPRFIMESLGMLLIAVVAYMMSSEESGIVSVIPMLGALALGAQRLLPVLQQAYSAWSTIKGGQTSLNDTLILLEQDLPVYINQHHSNSQLHFTENIILDGISFRYRPESNKILNQLNLTLSKGERIGIIGATGCGKSTLLDIIMGLLQPTDGHIKVDGELISPINFRAWQSQIAHVPQTIFLTDAKITNNIAFGIPEDQIDHEKVRQAAMQAQIHESIIRLPDQYETIVGERGIRLSGGQRQRIGIARALYKNASLIIFDEATSALDNETERSVMKAIESLDKDLTIIIVAHRVTTLKGCTKIIELHDGEIKGISTYEQISSIS